MSVQPTEKFPHVGKPQSDASNSSGAGGLRGNASLVLKQSENITANERSPWGECSSRLFASDSCFLQHGLLSLPSRLTNASYELGKNPLYATSQSNTGCTEVPFIWRIFIVCLALNVPTTRSRKRREENKETVRIKNQLYSASCDSHAINSDQKHLIPVPPRLYYVCCTYICTSACFLKSVTISVILFSFLFTGRRLLREQSWITLLNILELNFTVQKVTNQKKHIGSLEPM